MTGCASLDRHECLHADWYSIGLEDGARGDAVERLGDHRRACAKHSVAPDAERYLAGRNEGLRTFCTYERGFAEGRSGRTYTGACPRPQAFLTGYERGRELHDLHRRLSEVEKDIERTKNALKEGIPEARARARAVERLELLTREADQLQAKIEDVQRR